MTPESIGAACREFFNGPYDSGDYNRMAKALLCAEEVDDDKALREIDCGYLAEALRAAIRYARLDGCVPSTGGCGCDACVALRGLALYDRETK